MLSLLHTALTAASALIGIPLILLFLSNFWPLAVVLGCVVAWWLVAHVVLPLWRMEAELRKVRRDCAAALRDSRETLAQLQRQP